MTGKSQSALVKTAQFMRQNPHLAVPDMDEADVAALKAMNRGDATPEMQKRAFDCIVTKVGIIGDVCLGQDDRTTNFLLGRRFVAKFLVDTIRSNTPIFNKPN